MFPSVYNFLLTAPISQSLWRHSLLPYPFNLNQKSFTPFVKRYKNVSATENTISLFSHRLGVRMCVRALSVSHVRFTSCFIINQYESNQSPVTPSLSKEILLPIWPGLLSLQLPRTKLTIPGSIPLLHPPPGPSSIFRVIKMKEICYDWFPWLGSCLLNDFIV